MRSLKLDRARAAMRHAERAEASMGDSRQTSRVKADASLHAQRAILEYAEEVEGKVAALEKRVRKLEAGA